MSDLLPLSQLTRSCRPALRPGGAAPSPGAADRLSRLLMRKLGQAVSDFSMIAEGDRIMVCVSGGKDSYALLDLLLRLRERAPIAFELIAVNVDQGWPGYRTDLIAAHLAGLGVPHRMVMADDIAQVVEANVPAGKTPCSLCSRLRRGLLYNLAQELGCTKIALGHHADDLIETLVLNMFYSGKLASMPAVLHADDGRNTVIRPLCYVPEELLVELAAERRFPVVSCGCPSCGLPEQKRQVIKELLRQLEERDPGIKQNMLASLRNVKTSHLLDPSLIAG